MSNILEISYAVYSFLWDSLTRQIPKGKKIWRKFQDTKWFKEILFDT